MPTSERAIDVGSSTTIAITVVLFVISVFVGGFAHELLLEVAVFLVSVKLILMSARSALAQRSIEARLEAIRATLARVEAAVGEQRGSRSSG